MAVSFRCVVVNKNIAELEIKLGAIVLRFRLARAQGGSFIVESAHNRRLIPKDVKHSSNDADPLDKTKDVLEYVLAFLDVGLPPADIVKLTDLNLRLMGWSDTLKSTFIINLCANENTFAVNNGVIRDKNTFFTQSPIMPLALIDVKANVKIFGILAFYTRILLSR